MIESPSAIESQLSGFPVGYFVIKNAASHYVFDVNGDNAKDGTELIVWTDKETTMVESFRNPENNNQVFFIDCSGALCSRSTGHALDVEGDRIVLRHRRPISFPFPNTHAHPLPKFVYSADTGEISVQFVHDPTYPSTEGMPSVDWKSKAFVLTCGVSTRRISEESSAPKRRHLLNILFRSKKATRRSSSLSTPTTQKTSEKSSVVEAAEEVAEAQPEPAGWVEVPGSYTCDVRVVTVDTANTVVEDHRLSEDAKLRRRWLVIPLKD